LAEGWVTRSLPHSVYWGDGNHTIEAKLSGELLMVDFYESNNAQSNRVSLTLKIHFDRVELVDLTGNGIGNSTNNVGIGTLLVNVAIQILRTIYDGRLQDVSVRGTTCPLSGLDGREHEIDVANRVRFWTSFNLTIDEPEQPRAAIRGLLSEFRLKDRGKCLGKINTLLSIRDFWRGYHRPNLFPQELDSLRQLDLDKSSLLKLPSDEELDNKEEQTRNRYFYIRTVVTTAFFIFLVRLLFLNDLMSFNWLSGAIALTLAFQWLLHRFTFPFIHENFYQRQARKEKRLVVDREQEKLVEVNDHHPYIFARLYRSVTKTWPNQISSVLAESQDFSEYAYYKQNHQTILEWVKFIESFKNQFGQSINRKFMLAPHEVRDHLFEIQSNSITIGELTRYSELLETEFEFHLNRLLRSIGTHELSVSGNSNACPRKILKNLRSIAMIELYPNGPYFSDPMRVQMKIILREGTVFLEPQWGVYKDIRRHETLSGLSILLAEEFRNKAFIRDDDRLLPLSTDARDFILQILDLGNCRDIENDELHKYVEQLGSM
jgi:hypothetical protein